MSFQKKSHVYFTFSTDESMERVYPVLDRNGESTMKRWLLVWYSEVCTRLAEAINVLIYTEEKLLRAR